MQNAIENIALIELSYETYVTRETVDNINYGTEARKLKHWKTDRGGAPQMSVAFKNGNAVSFSRPSPLDK